MTWYKTLGFTELLLIVLFLVAYFFYARKSMALAKAFGTNPFKVFVKMAIRASYFALILIALLGPSFGVFKQEIKSVGKDIYFLIDLSNSMNAFDVQPSRIDKAKFEIKNIINSFASDRIGLIIFGADAFVQCPLTFDQSALMLFLETLNTGLVPNGGTDFYPPLNLALQKFTANGKDGIADKQSKIIVLVSDGEDFGDETEDVAKEIKKQGIKVFALGVGTEQGSKIPTAQGFKRNQNNEEVVSSINSEALKKLADITGGQYFEIGKERYDVPKLVSAISNIKGKLNASKQTDSAANKYLYFLAAALLLVVADILITVKSIPRI